MSAVHPRGKVLHIFILVKAVYETKKQLECNYEDCGIM